MKRVKKSGQKFWLSLIVVLVLSQQIFGQEITMSINNCTSTENQIQFDVCFTNNGPEVLRFNSAVIRFALSPGIISTDQNNIVFAYVGDSDFPLLWSIMNNPKFVYLPETSLFWVSTGTKIYTNGITCTAPVIAVGETKKIGRLAVKNTAGYFIAGTHILWNQTSGVVAYKDCSSTPVNFRLANGNCKLEEVCSFLMSTVYTSVRIE